MTTCLVGLGSNLGDRRQTLERAVQMLRDTPQVHVTAVSAWHTTRPVGGPAEQPEYLNGAVLLETSFEPPALLARLQEIEQTLGRTRGERWEPRTIDLDLLLYGDEVWDAPSLSLPHPRMAHRRFVIEPVAEIAGDVVHPTIGWSMTRLRDHLRTALPYVAIAGPLPSPKSWLADQVARQLSGRFVHEPYSLGRETPESGAGGRVEIPFLNQAAWALSADLWDGPEMLRVSDFWFDECLLHAEATLPPEKLAVFRTEWETSLERITRPKLLVILDAASESIQEETAGEDLGDEQPWRRAVLLEESDMLRQAILDRASQPGQGPVLRLLAADLSTALDETVAAIQAMQGEPAPRVDPASIGETPPNVELPLPSEPPPDEEGRQTE
jgi:2-amino-4-hydroxy-6-hydroxymethyldihydropteridine diphosphokinase